MAIPYGRLNFPLFILRRTVITFFALMSHDFTTQRPAKHFLYCNFLLFNLILLYFNFISFFNPFSRLIIFTPRTRSLFLLLTVQFVFLFTAETVHTNVFRRRSPKQSIYISMLPFPSVYDTEIIELQFHLPTR